MNNPIHFNTQKHNTRKLKIVGGQSAPITPKDTTTIAAPTAVKDEKASEGIEKGDKAEEAPLDDKDFEVPERKGIIKPLAHMAINVVETGSEFAVKKLSEITGVSTSGKDMGKMLHDFNEALRSPEIKEEVAKFIVNMTDNVIFAVDAMGPPVKKALDKVLDIADHASRKVIATGLQTASVSITEVPVIGNVWGGILIADNMVKLGESVVNAAVGTATNTADAVTETKMRIAKLQENKAKLEKRTSDSVSSFTNNDNTGTRKNMSSRLFEHAKTMKNRVTDFTSLPPEERNAKMKEAYTGIKSGLMKGASQVTGMSEEELTKKMNEKIGDINKKIEEFKTKIPKDASDTDVTRKTMEYTNSLKETALGQITGLTPQALLAKAGVSQETIDTAERLKRGSTGFAERMAHRALSFSGLAPEKKRTWGQYLKGEAKPVESVADRTQRAKDAMMDRFDPVGAKMKKDAAKKMADEAKRKEEELNPTAWSKTKNMFSRKQTPVKGGANRRKTRRIRRNKMRY